MKVYLGKFKDYIDSAIYALVIFLLLYAFLWPISVEGVSMEPSLNSGDRVFVCRALAALGLVEHGDVIMVKAYYDPDKKYIVKRVIGCPGDTVEISGGALYLNGELLNEPYIPGSIYTDGDFEQILGEEQYFLLGDNRDSSFDSRNFGVLHKSDIAGKVILRWFPINSIKVY